MKVGVADNRGNLLYPTKDWNKILMPAHLKPLPGDDVEVLQRKFAGFLVTTADWNGVGYGPGGQHKTGSAGSAGGSPATAATGDIQRRFVRCCGVPGAEANFG